MAFPSKKQVSELRKFTRKAWPLIATYLDQLVHEKRLGNGPHKGKPFCKQAWIEREFINSGCFKMVKVVEKFEGVASKKLTEENTRKEMIRVTIELYPRREA